MKQINKVEVLTLLTRETPYAAVKPCRYKGFKVEYFETQELTEEWLNPQSKETTKCTN